MAITLLSERVRAASAPAATALADVVFHQFHCRVSFIVSVACLTRATRVMSNCFANLMELSQGRFYTAIRRNMAVNVCNNV